MDFSGLGQNFRREIFKSRICEKKAAEKNKINLNFLGRNCRKKGTYKKSFPGRDNFRLRLTLARAMRDITVPMGNSIEEAISL